MKANLLAIALLAAKASAFLAPQRQSLLHAQASPCSQQALAMASSEAKSLIVISPPGGVGEVAAVKAAAMGSSVRWFVVSKEANQNVVLSQAALDNIAEAGGSVELAGADAESLLLPAEDPKSAISAVAKWCGSADGIACAFDGVAEGGEMTGTWKNAIKLAAKQVAPSVSGCKLAILSALEGQEEDQKEEKGGLGGLVGSLVGGEKAKVPATLAEALGPNPSNIAILRHGELFGMPESSPDFSPLVGGPQRNPEFCEEYCTRSVRIDPTLSVTGNFMMGKSTRSSRHSVGEAAALILQNKVHATGLDLCLSSQLGSEPVPLDDWKEEFERSAKMVKSGGGAQLFSASFSSVPDTERFADWIATKWAPAVLRTYDIATIRSGARPVFATRAGEGKTEIIWQELVDFKSVTVGKMVIQVSDTELVATRGPGDAAAGFGRISSKPLNGENVLLMRLAEAASQAIEKGLAKKVRTILQRFNGRAVPSSHIFFCQTLFFPENHEEGSSQGASCSRRRSSASGNNPRIVRNCCRSTQVRFGSATGWGASIQRARPWNQKEKIVFR
jgi:hypothetical protein